MKFLEQNSNYCYAAFRIVIGFLFLCHGSQKLFNFPLEFQYTLNAMTLTAGVIELVAGTFIMLGFYTRYAAFLASGTMAFAYWIAHGLNNLFPLVNGGELAALYCFSFLYISTKGSGIWSINQK